MHKSFFAAILYLLPLLLAGELAARLKGYAPLKDKLSSNNNIFYGITDQCMDSEAKSASHLRGSLPDLSNKHCKKNQTFQVLNIKPNFTTKFTSQEFNIQIQTSELGFRLPNGDLGSSILTMGDSFTYGHGVDGASTFSNQLYQLCHTPVLNASYQNGFAPEHYLWWIFKNKEVKPAIAIINLFVSNDLYSDVLETTLLDGDSRRGLTLLSRSVAVNGQLVSRFDSDTLVQRAVIMGAYYSSIGAFIFSVLRQKTRLFGNYPVPNTSIPFDLAYSGRVRPEILKRTIRAIENIRLVMVSRVTESKLVVAVIPDSLTDLDVSRMRTVNSNVIRSLKKALPSVVFVDASKTLEAEDFFSKDRHYNRHGHIKHARMLADILPKHMPSVRCSAR